MSMAHSIVEHIAYRLLAVIAGAVCRSLRLSRVNVGPVDELRGKKTNAVYAFWHGSMMLGWYAHTPKAGAPVSALVSMSRDGAILASVLEHWGYTLIRGSSHIGGKEALQSMVDAAAHGSSLCVTPDGPRGPRHEMKPGAVLSAQRAQVPLVIVGIACAKKKVFTRSWDRFELPLPFSRACLWYAAPGMIPADASRDEVSVLIAGVQQRLSDAHTQAHQALGIFEV